MPYLNQMYEKKAITQIQIRLRKSLVGLRLCSGPVPISGTDQTWQQRSVRGRALLFMRRAAWLLKLVLCNSVSAA